MQILDDQLMHHIANLPPDEAGEWLILVPHDEFIGAWNVESLDPSFFFDFEDLIGEYRTLFPSGLEAFKRRCDEFSYRIAWAIDPADTLRAYESLHTPPPFSIRSGLEGTVNGFLPWQIEGYNKLIRPDDLRGGLCFWDTGPQPLDARVLTPSGWNSMGAIQIGDKVIGSDGRPCKVTGVFDRGNDLVLRLRFRDGSTARCTENHLWEVYDSVGHRSVRTLKEILKSGLYHSRGDAKWFVNRVQVKGQKKELPIDPYLLGALIGDGSLTASTVQFYSHQGELVPYIEEVLPSRMRISKYGPKHFALVGTGGRNPLKAALKEVGIWGHKANTKFIPREYMLASIEQRQALLQGLLDTDGSVEKQSARMSTISDHLADDVLELVRSLGGRAVKSQRPACRRIIQGVEYQCQPIWILSLTLPPDIEPFRIARKRIPIRPPVGRNALVEVIAEDVQPVRCIEVSAKDSLYVTNDHILTHNTGKTVFVAMAIMHHTKVHDVDTVLVVVKSNNKTDMKRKLKKLADIDSVILDGYKPIKRIEKYVELDKLDRRVIIMNYEKFREDQPFMEALVTGRRVLVLWDEMPTKLKNRGTLLYNSVRDVLYQRVPNKDEPYNKEIRWNLKRPAWLRQYELTATPIERDPGDQFSCVRLIDPNVLGTASKFEKEHVLLRDPFSKKPKKWTRVDRIGHKLNHMMHRVDKTDAKVAPYFPKLIEEPVYIDWNDKHRRVYDALASKAALMLEDEEDISILALISALQMICDAPSMINMSALKREEFENLLIEASDDVEVARQGSEIAMRLMQQLGELSDENHPKLQRLKEDLTERYPNDKVIFFSTWAEYLHPIIMEHLDKWGVTYEVYAGTDKQRQTAKDRWRSDPDCRILVSSDAGSDSVDLPEASLVINYNLPWLFSRLRQRINRASRADSGHARLRVLNYLMADSVEERRMTLIEVRRGYHEEFTSLSVKESQSARYTMDDLLFALLGSDSGVILDGSSELDLQEQHF
jgi:hypothetical protein